MKDIDETDAPKGYVAVEPVEGCLECAFYEDFSECFVYSIMCDARHREDKQNVIFIKKADKEENK